MKKIFMRSLLLCYILLAFIPMLCTANAAEEDIIAFGICGKDLAWRLDSEGTMTIYGTGEMDHSYIMLHPWWSYYENIRTIIIGPNVTSISIDDFTGCENLIGWTVDEKNTKYANDEYGVLFNKNQTELLRASEAITGNYQIPEHVTTIGQNAFFGCSSLESITIPESVTEIGEDAFHACNSLKNVYYIGTKEQWSAINIDPSNQLRLNATIHYNTAEEDSIASGTCGENLTWTLDSDGTLTISGTGAMSNYDYDNKAPWYSQGDSILSVVVEDGVTTIGDNAFYYCTNLSSAEIGDSVTRIGDYAFNDCDSLSSITLPDSVTNVGNFAFRDCGSLSSIMLPEGVTDIGEQAFYHCGSLSSITIPGSITGIGNYAFAYCDSLCSITILEGVTSIGSFGTFENCGSLSSITLPESLTSIGDYAFYGCESISSITIPVGVTNIGNSAIRNCGSLSSITIPEGVTSIGDYAFQSCDSLDGIWVEDGNPNYSSDDHGVLFNKNKTQLIRAPGGISGVYSVPDGVTGINNFAFYDCDSLSSITFPDSVTTIDQSAFNHCGSLSNITIPDSVTNIDDYAFYNCDSIRTVHYAGTEAQRADISIGEENTDLTDATWHYECDGVVCMNPETPPTEPKPSEPKPTEPKPTEPKPTEPKPTEPKPTDPKPTEPKPTEPKPTEPKPTTPPAEGDKPATNPFVDVPGDAFYHDPVLWAVDNAVTNGLDATHFGPDAGCTRAHVVTFLWRAAGEPAPSSSYNPFTDVLPGAYYYDAVLWAVEKGITNGVSATAFAPDQTCTRGQIVTFLWRYQHSPSASGTTSFTDVPAGQYYSTAVSWAVANSITNGMGEGIFAPDATCTRGQIVTFLYRAMA